MKTFRHHETGRRYNVERCLYCAIMVACAVIFDFMGPTQQASALEASGYIAAESMLFVHPPRFPGQEEHSASISFQPELYQRWSGGNSVLFVPFARLDSADTERTHIDVRELYYLKVFDDWELGVGIRKVFWGVTESQHLVDMINQTDLVEHIDGEEKLGQPMVNASFVRDYGVFDFFIMPYFRKRTFPGTGGRLRQDIVVDNDLAEFESPAAEEHIDLAARYSRTLGAWSLGLSHFMGMSREPLLRAGTDASGKEVLIPVYMTINQTGLDLQWTGEGLLVKVESIYRTGQGKAFAAWTGGFEYTFYGLSSTGMDLGVLAEWSHDTRGEDATTPLEDDLMAGFRLSVNDTQSTEALAGIIQDLDSNARTIFIESSRRLGNNWRATLEAYLFNHQGSNDRTSGARDDDFVRIELAYYF